MKVPVIRRNESLLKKVVLGLCQEFRFIAGRFNPHGQRENQAMNDSSPKDDGRLLEAVAAEVSAEVYEIAVGDQDEPSRLDLDVGLPFAITGTLDGCVPESPGPAVQSNAEPDPR
jgi:hypothetical protein